jgi:hypothetical protein
MTIFTGREARFPVREAIFGKKPGFSASEGRPDAA